MTSAPMTVRDATRADLTTIVAIYNAAIPGRMATADTAPVSPQSRQVWFEEHDPARRPLWVACVERSVVGWLSFQSFYGRPAYQATAEISVYVAPGQRRGGIGRALLGRAVEAAPGLRLRALRGFVLRPHEPRPRPFPGLGFPRRAPVPRLAVLA